MAVPLESGVPHFQTPNGCDHMDQHCHFVHLLVDPSPKPRSGPCCGLSCSNSMSSHWDDLYIYNIYIHTHIYIYINCDRTPPWFPTTCNMFWYKDFLCCFFHFHFVRLFVGCFVAKRFAKRFCHKFFRQNFVRISSELELKQRNLWRNFDVFFCGKMLYHSYCKSWAAPTQNIFVLVSICMYAKRF